MKTLRLFPCLSFIVVFSLSAAYGQVEEKWARRFNGPGNGTDIAFGVAADSVGNVAVTGYTTLANGNADYYTAKYAANDGALLWEKSYDGAGGGDVAYGVAVDSAGNVIVTGTSWSGGFTCYTAKYGAATGALLWERRSIEPVINSSGGAYSVVVDGGDDVIITGYSFNATNRPDCYTAKYAGASGVLLWERRYNGPANSRAYDVAVDSGGNVAVTGFSDNASGNSDCYTAKYAGANGALLWEKRYNGPANGDDIGYSVAADNAGNVIVTGSSYNGSNNSYYTAKYAAGDGALLWEKRYNGPGNSYSEAFSVAVDNLGNVVVTGNSNGAGADIYTAKYAAADGALLWEKRYEGGANDQAYSVAVDSGGNVVVAGSASNGANDDIYTAKYAAADGAMLWEKRYNGPANGADRMNLTFPYAGKLALTPDGGAVVTGQSFNGSNYDYATVRYGPTVTSPTVVTSAATSVTASTATLNGTVNPNGILTSAWFEYGLTTSYGTSTASQAQGYGTSASPVNAALTGLTPNTLYHYRLVAQNGETTAYGSDLTFTTLTLQQGWRQQYFGTPSNTGNAADSFDFDKDGLVNLLEWACNLNPTTASVLPMTTIRNGVFFEFTYTRSVAALNAGATFTVEWSDTLPGPNTWSNSGVTEQLLSDNGTVQQVKATIPVGSNGHRFVHLKVTSPP